MGRIRSSPGARRGCKEQRARTTTTNLPIVNWPIELDSPGDAVARGLRGAVDLERDKRTPRNTTAGRLTSRQTTKAKNCHRCGSPSAQATIW